MNIYVPIPRLPSTYQEVEYIQSTGTQYINTGYIPSNNTKIEMSMGGFNSSTSSNSLFGARYSWNVDASIGRGFQWAVNTSTSPYGYGGMFGRRYSTGDDNFNVFNWGDGGNHILSLDQSGFYQDGVKKYTPNTVTFTSPVNLVIFSNNNNGQISEFAPYKLYYFKIRDNGTLVRNFIPCYRKSDNVIGLYDLVNSAFYTNAGSGTFSKGNDVTMSELKNDYIGEFVPYTPGENTIARYQFKSDIANHYGNDADWYIHSGSVSYENNMMKYTGELRKNKATLSGGYSGNFTVLSWRKREGTDSRIDLWRYDFSMNSGMSIPGGNAELCSVYAGGTWYAISLPQMTNGVHLFAMVRSGNTLYGYLDGNLIGSKSISGGLSNPLSCGTTSGAGGTVGETIAENKAWSQTGIQDYYNNTKANYGL